MTKKSLITTLSSLLIIIFIIITSLSTYDIPKNTNPKNNIKKEISHKEFGIDTLLYEKRISSVKRNETLSKILSNLGVPYDKIYQSQLQIKNIFDLRKIILGNDYYSFYSKDSTNSLNYFVYKISSADFLVLNFNDTLTAKIFKKEIKIKERSVTGIITNSLYESLVEQNITPELVIKLSEIYAWQIDFYRIMDGDKYIVIFEEELVDGKLIGIKKIVAAEFFHRNEKFYAINFKFDDQSEFFDENGKSLRKAFLKAPVKFSRISSRYSLRRYHPIEHRVKAHLGTDYVSPTGTPIRSTGDGIVITATYARFNGNFVKIKHNSVYTTQYLHMSKFGKGIRSGVRVKQGQIIGYVGMTGEATGPHVCYRFWKNGVQVDALRQKIPSAHPIDPKYLPEFNIVKNKVITELDSTIINYDEVKVATTGVMPP